MNINEFKAEALKSMNTFYIPQLSIGNKRLWDMMVVLIESLPSEPKPEPSKSLDEVMQGIHNLYQNSQYAPIPVIKFREDKDKYYTTEVKRILDESGLVLNEHYDKPIDECLDVIEKIPPMLFHRFIIQLKSKLEAMKDIK